MMHKYKLLLLIFLMLLPYQGHTSQSYPSMDDPFIKGVEDFENKRFFEATKTFVKCARQGNSIVFSYLTHIRTHPELLTEYKLSPQEEDFLAKVPLILPYLPSKFLNSPKRLDLDRETWLRASLLWLDYDLSQDDPTKIKAGIKELEGLVQDKDIDTHNSHVHYLLGWLYENDRKMQLSNKSDGLAVQHYMLSAYHADLQGLRGWKRMSDRLGKKGIQNIAKKLNNSFFADWYLSELEQYLLPDSTRKAVEQSAIKNQYLRSGEYCELAELSPEFILSYLYNGHIVKDFGKSPKRKLLWQIRAACLGERKTQEMIAKYLHDEKNDYYDKQEGLKWRNMLALHGIPERQLEFLNIFFRDTT